MPRYVCAFLPAFSIEYRNKAQACSPPEPFALVSQTSGGYHLDTPNPVAKRLGLYAGQLLSDARARVPELITCPVNRAQEQTRLRKLSLWCTRFSPYVAPWPEIEAGATGLTFDMTGCAHLFGGECAMLHIMATALAQLGLSVRLAMADSIGAAHALCRHGIKAQIIVDSATQIQALRDLPVAALRIGAQTVATLRHLGLTCIADVMDLPRAPLAARFGEELLLRLDQALGRAGESFSPILPHAPARVSAVLAEPIRDQDHVLKLATALAQDLMPLLERAGLGARTLNLNLFRVDGQVLRIALRLASASRDPDHIIKLFALKLDALNEAFDPGFGFDAARLDVTLGQPLEPIQAGLARTTPDATRLTRLIDRLASRLGTDNVLRAYPRDTHSPERAMALKPAGAPGIWGDWGLRPLLLLSRAEPAEVLALLPEGPPLQFKWRGMHYRIERAEGPERIAPQWWRSGESPTRDYYLVEDRAGHKFWMYRDGFYDAPHPPRWFVHGVFA